MPITRGPETYQNEVDGYRGRLEEYLTFLKARYVDFVEVELAREARWFFDLLMEIDLDERGEAILIDLINYLMLQSEIYSRRIKASTDPLEHKLGWQLFDHFSAGLYGGQSLEGSLLEFCQRNVTRLGIEKKGKRWYQIGVKIAGLIRRKGLKK